MTLHAKSIVPININEEMKNAYLEYAMSVIVGRALPDIRDGLKPVHRRVLYSMFEQGIYHNKPYRKSARVVGDVLGKYHPHGDTAVYDALVRLAQDFSLRYPLIDGQGNFGSIDGDSPAAMRYTEVRMAKVAQAIMQDINEETVDFAPNYDQSETEPLVLPTVLPQLLVNGQSGIAVGMATNIPPHNLTEVLDALIYLLDNEHATIEDLMKFVRGPDFPTYGIICGMKGIYDAYRTGRGSVVVRGRATVETTKTGREQIIITELPYQVNKAALIERIADLVKEEEIQGISDIRDESNKEGIRVVIEVKKTENAEVLLNHIYKRTRLQDTFGVNMVCIVRGVPKLITLKEALEHFRDHRLEVVTRRTNYRLRKAEEKLHILEGLKIAVDNLDAAIAIIRGADSPEAARETLMSRFTLSEKQAAAILEMRLARLTALERDKIIADHAETLNIIADLKDILAKPERVKSIIREEFLQLKADFGDGRRTEITTDAADLDIEALVPPADVLVMLSTAGYVKRVNQEEFRAQKRAGRGKTGAALKESDVIKFTFRAHTHEHVLMFSNLGKVYAMKVYELPESAPGAKGKSLAQFLTLQPEEHITAMLPVREFDENHYIFMATSQGTVKKTELSAFANIRASGMRALMLDEGDQLISVKITDGTNEIVLATSFGKSIRFKEDDVRAMGRSARGVTGMKIDDADTVMVAEVIDSKEKLLVVTELGYGKRSEVDEYRVQTRAGKGINTLRITEKNGKVMSILSVADSEDVMLITNTGRVIRTPVSGITISGRVTQGVCIMRLMEGEKIVSVSKPNEMDDTPATEIETTEEVE